MEDDSRMKVADDLFIVMVQGSALQEQEINAQKMDPSKFDRLVENTRLRGGLESVPYAHQPGGAGPITVISGHHRAKAARLAGLKTFPVLVDTREMPRSLIRAKQIAHNELTGSPDEEILRQMIAQIDSVDDLLMTGLPNEVLAALEDTPSTSLNLPHAEFDWRMVTLTFLPDQLERLEELVALTTAGAHTVGVAHLSQFEPFSKAVVAYAQTVNIKNMATAIDQLTQMALRELANAAEAEVSEEDAAPDPRSNRPADGRPRKQKKTSA